MPDESMTFIRRYPKMWVMICFECQYAADFTTWELAKRARLTHQTFCPTRNSTEVIREEGTRV